MQESFDFSDSETTDNSSENKDKMPQDDVQSFFWCACDKYYSSILLIKPGNAVVNKHTITVYDVSGEKVNQVELEFPNKQIGIFELDAICNDCKLTGGIRQAQIRVVSPSGTLHECKIHTIANDCYVSDVQNISREQAAFYPLTLSTHSANLIAFNNTGNIPVALRCRLYTGTRSPETEIQVPAFGTACKNVEVDFAEYLDLAAGAIVQAYIRIVAGSSSSLQVRLFEKRYHSRAMQEVME